LQGSVLTIAIQTDAGSPRSIRLYRTIPEVALRDPRLRKISQIKPGIFYLDVERVSAEDFKAALPELEQAKGIVIDLRGEARGLNDEPVSHLIDSTISMIRWSLPVVTQPDRKHIVFVPGRLTVEPAQPRFNARLSYIADCRTSKNGESWLALVRQFKLGEIVGDASAGLDGIENSISLTGGYRILWVTATRQDNPRQQSAAIMPTVPVQRTIQGIREDRDELLERAIAAVSE
jgi:C-terminal processing protease CtpA/Prc